MDTIFAVVTAVQKAGVFIIRISGEKALECLIKLGIKKKLKHQTISFHKIFDPENGNLIDEVLVSFFQSPKSFTGEDIVEINCHGSYFILQKIFLILSEIEGVRIAEAGEFSRRAFLNNKIDLVQAEAIPDLIASESELQHQQSILQLQGQLGKVYESWRNDLIEALAMIEAAIDFPEDDLPQELINKVEQKIKFLIQQIKDHLNDQKIGQKIKDGLSLVIIGKPNVGKSTLINFLTKKELAIVSDIAGTTRDIIEADFFIAGIPIKISDTAGIRDSEDLIEKEGIKRALNKAKEADLKILLIDATDPSFPINLIDEKTILVINKIDLIDDKKIFDEQMIKISLSKKINLSVLNEQIENRVKKIIPPNKNLLITQERYRICLKNSIANLEKFSLQKNIEISAEYLRIATQEIGKINGKVDIENILDSIFSKFCIGK
jgi:tRNA modification GTPase